MENIIRYSTPEEQVEKLISQNLNINDKQFACAALMSFGYSNLIKSYRNPYIVNIDEKKSIVMALVLTRFIHCLYLINQYVML